MVRGNWQRRVELTASARQASKLQKEEKKKKNLRRQQQQYLAQEEEEEEEEGWQSQTSWGRRTTTMTTNTMIMTGTEEDYDQQQQQQRLVEWLHEKGDILFLGLNNRSRNEEDNTTTTTTTTTTTNYDDSNNNSGDCKGETTIAVVDIWTTTLPIHRTECSSPFSSMHLNNNNHNNNVFEKKEDGDLSVNDDNTNLHSSSHHSPWSLRSMGGTTTTPTTSSGSGRGEDTVITAAAAAAGSGGNSGRKKKKGKAHPNTKNKSNNNNHNTSALTMIEKMSTTTGDNTTTTTTTTTTTVSTGVLGNNGGDDGGSRSSSSRRRDRSSSITSQNGKDEEIMKESQKLCTREFFFDKCRGGGMMVMQPSHTKRGSGRKIRSSSIGNASEDDTNSRSRSSSIGDDGGGGCHLRHYHQLSKKKTYCKTLQQSSRGNNNIPLLPTPPMTLAQVVLNEKFYPPYYYYPPPPPPLPRMIDNHEDGKQKDLRKNKPISLLPLNVRELSLQSSHDALVISMEAKRSCASSSSPSSWYYMDMIYHTRFAVRSDDEEEDDDDDKILLLSNADSSSISQCCHVNVNYDKEAVVEYDADAGWRNQSSPPPPIKKSKIHKAIEQILMEYNIPSIMSIAYLTIQGVLIYDRYRGGLVISEKEERYLLYGEAITAIDVSRETSMINHRSYLNSNDGNYPIDESITTASTTLPQHERLTYQLLEEILAYCEDECVCSMSLVCKFWHEEIIHSPQLWKMLLSRHGWPLRVNGNLDDNNKDRLTVDGGDSDDLKDDNGGHLSEQLRQSFISYYLARRDIRALSNASTYIMRNDGGGNGTGLESANLIFKTIKGFTTTTKETRAIVKIWSDANENNVRSLVAYANCTLRLFEVVRGSNDCNKVVHGRKDSRGIKCRQVVYIRISPLSISRKANRLVSMDLDDDYVACLIIRRVDINNSSIFREDPWLMVVARDDVVSAGNEGLMEDFVQSYDLRELILNFLMFSCADNLYDELVLNIYEYLAINEGETADIAVSVEPNVVVCGKGYFLFSASIGLPDGFEFGVEEESNDPSFRLLRGHRLLLFSARTRTFVKSLVLERERERATVFASRPFRSRSNANVDMLCTNIIVSDPSMPFSLISAEIRRDGTIDLRNNAVIEKDEFAPWSTMNAALTSTHTVFTTNPSHGPILHIQGLYASHDISYNLDQGFRSIEVGGARCEVHNIFILRDHFVAVVIHDSCNQGEDEEEFDGEWLGLNEAYHDEASFWIIMYHIPSSHEICRYPLTIQKPPPTEAYAFDCVGNTLAMNVSNLGFAVTGENARDIGSISLPVEKTSIIKSPSGKQPKGKKKRLASLASGRKKDGFARGMSLRG